MLGEVGGRIVLRREVHRFHNPSTRVRVATSSLYIGEASTPTNTPSRSCSLSNNKIFAPIIDVFCCNPKVLNPEKRASFSTPQAYIVASFSPTAALPWLPPTLLPLLHALLRLLVLLNLVEKHHHNCCIIHCIPTHRTRQTQNPRKQPPPRATHRVPR